MTMNERLDSAEVVQVVCATLAKGNGTPDDPVRHVLRYYDLNGNYIGDVCHNYTRGTLEASSANK